jgi:hypothetical protein
VLDGENMAAVLLQDGERAETERRQSVRADAVEIFTFATSFYGSALLAQRGRGKGDDLASKAVHSTGGEGTVDAREGLRCPSA